MIPDKLILHCSATPDGESYSWDAIRRYHIEVNGWVDIGYHYGLEHYGNKLIILRGRMPWEMGAHCRAAGRNRDSLGVCVVGQFDDMPPEPVVYEAAVRLLAGLCWTFHIEPRNVYGHREFESMKTCPGAKWNLAQTREDIDRLLPVYVPASLFGI